MDHTGTQLLMVLILVRQGRGRRQQTSAQVVGRGLGLKTLAQGQDTRHMRTGHAGSTHELVVMTIDLGSVQAGGQDIDTGGRQIDPVAIIGKGRSFAIVVRGRHGQYLGMCSGIIRLIGIEIASRKDNQDTLVCGVFNGRFEWPGNVIGRCVAPRIGTNVCSHIGRIHQGLRKAPDVGFAKRDTGQNTDIELGKSGNPGDTLAIVGIGGNGARDMGSMTAIAQEGRTGIVCIIVSMTIINVSIAIIVNAIGTIRLSRIDPLVVWLCIDKKKNRIARKMW